MFRQAVQIRLERPLRLDLLVLDPTEVEARCSFQVEAAEQIGTGVLLVGGKPEDGRSRVGLKLDRVIGLVAASGTLHREQHRAAIGRMLLESGIVPVQEPADPPPATAPPATKRAATSGGSTRWYPAGEVVEVAGYRLPGMVYVGRRLASPTNPLADDGCLIDPLLSVAARNLTAGVPELPYWPSYREIPPAGRRAYLNWLADGRRQPDISIGYVFLFFYGLERRLLVDQPDPAESASLAAEIRRLLELYGSNGSFAGYSAGLLDFLALRDAAGSGNREPLLPDLHDEPLVLPPKTQLQLATKIAADRPLAADEAIALFLARGALRVPLLRTRAECLTLARAKLTERYPQGLRLQPDRQSVLGQYRPASRALDDQLAATGSLLPDPVLGVDLQPVAQLMGEVADAMAPYQRFVGREPEREHSLAATLLLPELLAAPRLALARKRLEVDLAPCAGPDGLAALAIGKLKALVLEDREPGIDTRQHTLLAQALALLGYGIEPDPAYTSTRARPDDRAVLFPLAAPATARQPRPAYRQATLLATLVAGIAGAKDGKLDPAEQRWLDRVTAALELGDDERRRLDAHLRWLIGRELGLAPFKRLAAELPPDERRRVARLAVELGAVDGTLDRGEVAFLEKIHDAMGIARAELYAELHASLGNRAVPSDDPVDILVPGQTERGHVLPRPEPAGPTSMPMGPLDAAQVARIHAETEAVATLLAGIFADEAEPASATSAAIVTAATGAAAYPGLDQRHADFLPHLLGKESWSRAEATALAREHGLMLDGALETINEWSFARFDEALIEDDEFLLVARHLLEASP